jgi:hypothetical protein
MGTLYDNLGIGENTQIGISLEGKLLNVGMKISSKKMVSSLLEKYTCFSGPELVNSYCLSRGVGNPHLVGGYMGMQREWSINIERTFGTFDANVARAYKKMVTRQGQTFKITEVLTPSCSQISHQWYSLNQ